MTIEYRQITAAERRRFGVVIERGFGGYYEPSAEKYRLDRQTLTPEMSMCAFDGDEIVGTTGAHPFESAVPGGAIIKNAGVTAVTVSGTHRRQGLLNGMMKRLLRQERDKGQPLASLWASESIIYGRYGFGMAIQHEAYKIDTRKAALRDVLEIPGKIRFVDTDDALKVVPDAWEAAVNNHVGIPRKDEAHWNRWVLGLRDRGEGGKPWLVSYEEDGKALGFAMYLVKELHVFGEKSHGLIRIRSFRSGVVVSNSLAVPMVLDVCRRRKLPTLRYRLLRWRRSIWVVRSLPISNGQAVWKKTPSDRSLWQMPCLPR